MFNYQTLLSNPVLFIVGFLALIISIGVHEFAHVYAAYLQGDQTGKLLGRLTLNPIKHLDPIGTLAIVFIGLGWGKPAPFNPLALRYRRWGSALVAIAGPISNIILVAVAGYLYLALVSHLESGNLLRVFLGTMVILNGSLAVFNLIPVHPLDGSHILEGLLGADHPVVQGLRTYGPWLLLLLIFFSQGIISTWIQGGMSLILRILGLGQLL